MGPEGYELISRQISTRARARLRADVTVADSDGNTPISAGSVIGHTAIVTELVRKPEQMPNQRSRLQPAELQPPWAHDVYQRSVSSCLRAPQQEHCLRVHHRPRLPSLDPQQLTGKDSTMRIFSRGTHTHTRTHIHVLAAVADRSRHSCTAPYLPGSSAQDKEPVHATISCKGAVFCFS